MRVPPNFSSAILFHFLRNFPLHIHTSPINDLYNLVRLSKFLVEHMFCEYMFYYIPPTESCQFNFCRLGVCGVNIKFYYHFTHHQDFNNHDVGYLITNFRTPYFRVHPIIPHIAGDCKHFCKYSSYSFKIFYNFVTFRTIRLFWNSSVRHQICL